MNYWQWVSLQTDLLSIFIYVMVVFAGASAAFISVLLLILYGNHVGGPFGGVVGVAIPAAVLLGMSYMRYRRNTRI